MVLRLSSRSALRSLSVVQLKSGGQFRGVYVFAARDVKLIPSFLHSMTVCSWMLTGRITLAEMPDESNAGHGLTTAPPMQGLKANSGQGNQQGQLRQQGFWSGRWESNCIPNPQVLCFDGVAVRPESNWSHMESSFCNLRGFKEFGHQNELLRHSVSQAHLVAVLHADVPFRATGSLLACIDFTRSAADAPSSGSPTRL